MSADKKKSKFKKNNIWVDPFGNFYIFKRLIIFIFGLISYNRYNGFNRLHLNGVEHLQELPNTNVLFVSNHQTYFADVFAMFHVFCSVKNGFVNTIKNPIYLLNPKVDLYYIAAKETMNKGFLAKLFSYTGAITVKRTWREAGKDVKRQVDLNEVDKIEMALKNGWVITFPQGTTKAFSPGRKGTAHIIRKFEPIVIPVVIDGFRRAYDKKGLIVKTKGVNQTMTFKPALEIDYKKENKDEIMLKIMDAIEQSPDFLKVKSVEELAELEAEQNDKYPFYS